MSSKADSYMVGGEHYKTINPAQEHWNLVLAYKWDYFTAMAVKYLMRWRKKNGVEDLKKAKHFIEKLIEIEEAEAENEYKGADHD